MTPVLKRIELAWRRAWIGAIVAALRSRSDRTPPDWSTGRHRVLFLRHDRIGDMIVTTGVLRAIAESHQTIELDVLASPANAPILSTANWVHEVVVFDKKRLGGYLRTMRALRRAHYDVVVDCMVTAPSLTTLLLMLASGARHRIGIAGRGLESVLTIPVAPLPDSGAHLIEQLARLATPFGVSPSGEALRPEIALTAAERADAEARWQRPHGAPRLLVNVSSGTPHRRWPEERFGEVADAVRSGWPDAELLVIGSPDERERAGRIAARAGATYVPTRGVREALALVATADVVFSPDTSVVHAAGAFNRPTVAMYLAGKTHLWVPYRTPTRTIDWPAPTLDELPSAPVIAALEAHLAEHVGPSAAGLGTQRVADR